MRGVKRFLPAAPLSLSRERLTIGALLLAGLALAAGATPRLLAHLLMRAGDVPVAALKRGETLPPSRLAAAMDSRAAALAWITLPDAWSDLGGLALARAQDPALSAGARRAVAARSMAAFRRGLASGPARPYAWTQFAQAAFSRGLDGGLVSGALGVSLDLGPAEPPLVERRVRFGFAARAVLSEAVAARIHGQVRLMARHAPRRLAAFARERFALAWVRAALAADPPLRARFDRAYLRLPPT